MNFIHSHERGYEEDFRQCSFRCHSLHSPGVHSHPDDHGPHVVQHQIIAGRTPRPALRACISVGSVPTGIKDMPAIKKMLSSIKPGAEQDSQFGSRKKLNTRLHKKNKSSFKLHGFGNVHNDSPLRKEAETQIHNPAPAPAPRHGKTDSLGPANHMKRFDPGVYYGYSIPRPDKLEKHVSQDPLSPEDAFLVSRFGMKINTANTPVIGEDEPWTIHSPAHGTHSENHESSSNSPLAEENSSIHLHKRPMTAPADVNPYRDAMLTTEYWDASPKAGRIESLAGDLQERFARLRQGGSWSARNPWEVPEDVNLDRPKLSGTKVRNSIEMRELRNSKSPTDSAISFVEDDDALPSSSKGKGRQSNSQQLVQGVMREIDALITECPSANHLRLSTPGCEYNGWDQEKGRERMEDQGREELKLLQRWRDDLVRSQENETLRQEEIAREHWENYKFPLDGDLAGVERQLYKEQSRVVAERIRKLEREAEDWIQSNELEEQLLIRGQEEADRIRAQEIQEELRDEQLREEEADRIRAQEIQEELKEELEQACLVAKRARSRECACCSDTKDIFEFPAKASTKQCDHGSRTCTECVQTWMSSEFEIKGCEGIKCPDCQQTLEYGDVQRASSAETFDAYDKLATRNALGALDEFAWCLAADCGSGQLNIENNNFMNCINCGYKQCLEHKVPWHAGETCEKYEYRTSGLKARDEENKTEAMLDLVSKKCPGKNCGWRIQKLDGCEHMTCRKCKHEFCWQCLASQSEIKRMGNTAHALTCKFHSHNLDVAWPFNMH